MKLILKTLITVFMATSLSTAFASKMGKKAMPIKKTDMTSEVNIEKSTFTWTGTKKVGEKHYGPIKLKNAKVTMKNKKVVGGTFTMDMATIDSTDMKGQPLYGKLVKHLKDPDFFDVIAHPTATLAIDKMDGKVAQGTLTIKGNPLPVTIPYTQTDKVFKGKMTFDRTKFNIDYGSAGFLKKLKKYVEKKVINNDVDVDFAVSLQ